MNVDLIKMVNNPPSDQDNEVLKKVAEDPKATFAERLACAAWINGHRSIENYLILCTLATK